MAGRHFTAQFDPGTGTLALLGALEPAHWLVIRDEVDRAFRRTAVKLVIDLSRADRVPSATLGRLVHLCNTRYPGTFVRMPARPYVPALA
ncbi:MAG: hypothetical protein ACRDOM_01140 [Nocardioides sp.]